MNRLGYPFHIVKARPQTRKGIPTRLTVLQRRASIPLRLFMNAVPLLLVLLAPVLTGCAHRSRSSVEAGPEEDWTLTVNNHHWLDVSVFVLHEGGRTRLGTVSATRNETYTLPSRMIDGSRTVRFEANPIGATRSVTTDAVAVRGGGHVELTLESGLERSSVAVW